MRGPHPHPTITLLTIQHIQVIGTAELEMHISYPTMYCSFTISLHDHCNHSPLANLFLHQQTHPSLCHTKPRADAALPTLVYCLRRINTSKTNQTTSIVQYSTQSPCLPHHHLTHLNPVHGNWDKYMQQNQTSS